MKKNIDQIFDPNSLESLFIFEMANNHMGDVRHGLKIIDEIGKISRNYSFNFAFKFQARHIDTFIHPDFKKRSDIRYVRRFSETKLKESDYVTLKRALKKYSFISMCTPFDEKSVDLIEKLHFDILKIGSCSFGDWPLLERVAKTNMPIIASSAGASLETIDNVVSFFLHRNKKFALMHCVGEYPTVEKNLELNQIDLLKARFPEIAIGYSTHEEPSNYNSVMLAIAKGASFFEKHIGIKTEKYDMNAYSASPEQVKNWLESAKRAFLMGGISGRRYISSKKEKADLRQFQRGVFAKRNIKRGELVNKEDVFFAFPNKDGQIIANEMSKYVNFYAKKGIIAKAPIMHKDTNTIYTREKVYSIVKKIQKMLDQSRIFIPDKLEFELSHHYGMDMIHRFGAVLITVVNREYAKKLVVLLPGQKHPIHYHKKKEETFHILSGDFVLNLNGKSKEYREGDVITVERGMKHGFETRRGVIFEEISTTHSISDSFYDDEQINKNKNRKTYLTYWKD